jgi:hypothetical protein
MLPGRSDLRQERAAPSRLREPAIGGHQDRVERIGGDEVARVIHADSACEGATKRVANQHIESNDVERQSQDAIECPVRLVGAHVPPANGDRERVGHLRVCELGYESADASGDNSFDPGGSSRVVFSEYAPHQGACVKDRASGRSHGPVE